MAAVRGTAESGGEALLPYRTQRKYYEQRVRGGTAANRVLDCPVKRTLAARERRVWAAAPFSSEGGPRHVPSGRWPAQWLPSESLEMPSVSEPTRLLPRLNDDRWACERSSVQFSAGAVLSYDNFSSRLVHNQQPPGEAEHATCPPANGSAAKTSQPSAPQQRGHVGYELHKNLEYTDTKTGTHLMLHAGMYPDTVVIARYDDKQIECCASNVIFQKSNSATCTRTLPFLLTALLVVAFSALFSKHSRS